MAKPDRDRDEPLSLMNFTFQNREGPSGHVILSAGAEALSGANGEESVPRRAEILRFAQNDMAWTAQIADFDRKNSPGLSIRLEKFTRFRPARAHSHRADFLLLVLL